MKIETKYSIGDQVFTVQGRILEGVVRHIYTSTTANNSSTIKYTAFNGYGEFLEAQLFATKEEAGLAWLKSQGLDCGLKQ